MPKNRDGRVDVDRVKALFWASPYFEWAPFAEAQRWDIIQTHNNFPVRDWVDSKVRELEFIQSQKLRHAIFQTRHEYDNRVVEALRSLPTVADLALSIYLEAAKDFQARQSKPLAKDRPTVSEVHAITSAAERVIEMKQKSLMMHKFNVEFIRRESLAPPSPPAQGNPHDKPEAVNSEHVLDIKIIGAERMTAKEMQGLMFSYIDQMKTVSAPVDESISNDASEIPASNDTNTEEG